MLKHSTFVTSDVCSATLDLEDDACVESAEIFCFFHLQVVLVPFLEALGGRAISRNVWTATALASVGRNLITFPLFFEEDMEGA